MSTVSTGREGETIAAVYLKSIGYQILSHNVRTVAGEADLVAMDGKTLVVVEVKRLRNSEGAEEAVNRRKLTRLARISTLLSARFHTEYVRIDVVAIQGNRVSRHLQNLEIS